MKGKVKWFADDRGYGFISPEDGTKDVFCHHTSIKMDGRRNLTDGQSVQFEIEVTEKGPRAVNVIPL